MKQGSADDPFADEPEDSDSAGDESSDTSPSTDRSRDDVSPSTDGSREDLSSSAETSPDSETVEREPDTQQRSLPYIHARDGVKDGRTQRPVFLRDHVEAGIDELVARMEADLGEDVYKTDVTEAAMAVAEENPQLVLAKLEEWGYGMT